MSDFLNGLKSLNETVSGALSLIESFNKAKELDFTDYALAQKLKDPVFKSRMKKLLDEAGQ